MTSISFVPVTKKDFAQLFEWLRVPHVAKWWHPDILPWDEFIAKYQKFLNSESIWGYIIHINDKPVGFIQAYDAHQTPDENCNCDPEGTFGMDLYIADTTYIGKGYGTKVLRAFLDKLIKEHHVKKFIIDPDVQNLVAIKTYSKLGFKAVKEERFDRLGHLLIMELTIAPL